MIKIRNVITVLIVGANCGLMGLVAIRQVAYEVRALSVNPNLLSRRFAEMRRNCSYVREDHKRDLACAREGKVR